MFARSPREAGRVVTPPTVWPGARFVRRWTSVTLALVIAVALSIFADVAVATSASASVSAPVVTQCDPPAFPTGAGYQVTCTVTIDNTLTAQSATSSTVTATACLTAAGRLPPIGCITTVTTSTQLVTAVDQCNGITYGGGSNVICKVIIDNTVPVGTGTA